jgi:transcriptional accessory protein Tex/SPT6
MSSPQIVSTVARELSLSVGQYQHDVNQTRLKQRLDEIVRAASTASASR